MHRRSVALLTIVMQAAACGFPAQVANPSASNPPSASPSPVATTVPPVATASPTPISLPTTAHLSASAGNVVWVLVGELLLFRSINRGDAWEQRGLPSEAASGIGPLKELSFVNDHEGWVSIAGSPATQCQQQALRIWHTTDAGVSYQQIPETGSIVGSTPSGISGAQCKSGLYFSDPLHGFIGAWDPNSAPVIYRTNDGGLTWQASARLPDPPGFKTQGGGFTLRPGPVRAFASTLLLAANGVSNGTPFEYVFRSTDGGASWAHLATVQSTGTPIVFVTATRWLRIGAPGESVETTDAGASWHAFATDYAQAAPVAPEIVFGDAQTGYATVRGQLKRTLDGGAHWTDIKTPGTG